MDKLTAKQILIYWLKKHYYDGLCGDKCGCGVDDLIICDEDPSDCVPGYKVPVLPEYVDELGEYIYSANKEAPTAEELEELY